MHIIPESQLNIDDIVTALNEGKTIVYPTETCYGLGCDAHNEEAVARLFAIKARQENKSMLVVVPDISMLFEYVVWHKRLQQIADRFWPGALTVVAQTHPDVSLPKGIVGPGNTIAFRVTSHPLASELSQRLGRPIVSTSANVASFESPYDMESVLAMYENSPHQPDIIIDAGALPHRSPSTVVKVSPQGKVDVLRQGEIIVPTKLRW